MGLGLYWALLSKIMLTFVIESVLPMILGGVAVHIGRDLYDSYVKPYLSTTPEFTDVKTQSNTPMVEEQPQVFEDEEALMIGFRRTGNGYTAIFK